jgi:hypothetical protein
MAVKNWLCLGVLITAWLVPGSAWCQLDVPGPRFEHHAIEDPDSTRPWATPGIYDYDYQIFSPVQFTNGEELGPNTGFYFSMDRIYTSISGGGEFGGGAGDNYIWGNRYDVGYMNTEDDGWSLVYEQSEGNQFLNGADVIVANPTLFTTKLASVELNKVYRQTLKRGGWLEPYAGLRYFNVSDSTIEDFGAGVIGGIAANRFRQNFTNDAVGLNVGGRLVNRRGRFRFSNDLSIATTYNQQRFRATDFTMVGANIFITEIGDSDSAFVPAVDYRFELAYNISRDFGLRGGANFMYLWNGIARANTRPTLTNPNSAFGSDPAFGGDPTLPGGGLIDDRIIAAGVSLGFEYRR